MSFIPKVLIIAGSDSGGGAGIQADIKTTSYFKGYAMTAITAITAQNTVGVQSIYPLPKEIVMEQINSITTDLSPDIVKIGMLADLDIIEYISKKISNYKIVLDPVMVATSGDVLVSDEVVSSIKNNLIRYDETNKIVENAETYYEILDKNNNSTFIQLKPITGRKHQLRKQLFDLGHSIIGDKKYNSYKIQKNNKNLMLHSYEIKFKMNEKKYTFRATPPEYFRNMLKAKRLNF